MTQTTEEVKSALSDYWRVRRSGYKPLEMAQLLENMLSLGEAAGGERIAVGWGDRSYHQTDIVKSQQRIQLDAGPLLGAPAPVPGDRLDVVAGMMIHEVAHGRFDSRKAQESLLLRLSRARRYDETVAVKELFGWLEDYYVDRRLTRGNALHGRYVRAARDFYDVPEAAVMCAKALALDVTPEMKLTALTKMVGMMLVYGHALPEEMPTELLEPLVKILGMCQKLSDDPGKRAASLVKIWDALRGAVGELAAAPPPPTGGEEEGEPDQSQSAKALSGGSGVSQATGDDPNDQAQPQGPPQQPADEGGDEEAEGGAPEGDEEKDAEEDAQDAAPTTPTLDDLRPTLEDHKTPAPADLEAAIGEARRLNAEDLAQEAVAALGAGGVDNQQHLMMDAETKPDYEAWANELAQPYRDHIARIFERFQTQNRRWVRGLTEGRISPHRLWRAGMGRNDIMQRRELMHGSGLALALVLDGSGSIAGHRQKILDPLAAAVVTTASPETEVWVTSYTSGSGRSNVGTVVRVMARPEWGRVMRCGVDEPQDTPSGVGLLAAAPLMRRSRKRTKLVIHITDGQPGHVAGVAGFVAVHDAEHYLRQQGIEVVTLMVGDYFTNLSPESQTMLDWAYRTWEAVATMEEVPGAVERLLARVAREA